MSKPVNLDAAAEQEFAAAEAWYEERAGLGVDFVAAVRESGREIARRPRSFPLAKGVSPRFEIRRCPVRRFPYALFCLELPGEYRVIAVGHSRRRPGYWRTRL